MDFLHVFIFKLVAHNRQTGQTDSWGDNAHGDLNSSIGYEVFLVNTPRKLPTNSNCTTRTFKTHGTRVEKSIVTDLINMNCDCRNDFRPPDDVVDFHTEIVHVGHDAAIDIQLTRVTIQPNHTHTQTESVKILTKIITQKNMK